MASHVADIFLKRTHQGIVHAFYVYVEEYTLGDIRIAPLASMMQHPKYRGHVQEKMNVLASRVSRANLNTTFFCYFDHVLQTRDPEFIQWFLQDMYPFKETFDTARLCHVIQAIPDHPEVFEKFMFDDFDMQRKILDEFAWKNDISNRPENVMKIVRYLFAKFSVGPLDDAAWKFLNHAAERGVRMHRFLDEEFCYDQHVARDRPDVHMKRRPILVKHGAWKTLNRIDTSGLFRTIRDTRFTFAFEDEQDVHAFVQAWSKIVQEVRLVKQAFVTFTQFMPLRSEILQAMGRSYKDELVFAAIERGDYDMYQQAIDRCIQFVSVASKPRGTCNFWPKLTFHTDKDKASSHLSLNCTPTTPRIYKSCSIYNGQTIARKAFDFAIFERPENMSTYSLIVTLWQEFNLSPTLNYIVEQCTDVEIVRWYHSNVQAFTSAYVSPVSSKVTRCIFECVETTSGCLPTFDSIHWVGTSGDWLTGYRSFREYACDAMGWSDIKRENVLFVLSVPNYAAQLTILQTPGAFFDVEFFNAIHQNKLIPNIAESIFASTVFTNRTTSLEHFQQLYALCREYVQTTRQENQFNLIHKSSQLNQFVWFVMIECCKYGPFDLLEYLFKTFPGMCKPEFLQQVARGIKTRDSILVYLIERFPDAPWDVTKMLYHK